MYEYESYKVTKASPGKRNYHLCWKFIPTGSGMDKVLANIPAGIDHAGRVSPNKHKILLKTLEQLAFASIETYFLAIDNQMLMDSCMECSRTLVRICHPHPLTLDLQSSYSTHAGRDLTPLISNCNPDLVRVGDN